MSGVRRDDRDRFDQLPRTLQAKYHDDYRSSYKEVLHCIVSHVCTDAKKPDYLHVELTVEGIGGECHLTPRAVFAAIKWLEKHGYLLVERCQGHRSAYWVVLCSKEIQEWRQRGHDQALAHYRNWVAKRRDQIQAGTHGVNSSSSPGVNQSSGRTSVHPIREVTGIGGSIQGETAGSKPPASCDAEDHQDDSKDKNNGGGEVKVVVMPAHFGMPPKYRPLTDEEREKSIAEVRRQGAAIVEEAGRKDQGAAG